MRRVTLTLTILTEESVDELILTLDTCFRQYMTFESWEILASTEVGDSDER